MRLKRVRIFGFKTFADKTEVNLDGGIVAVVGPNGCGKSNLVDAILWALGESNARHLRANASQDVIFSGSARRRPVGFAEVTLLFDNEDGALPIESTEVSITRRLNRAGDSEYFINRRACRQRDVHELLADSGLGRAGYSIVGQKEIDQALAASPEDRRAWVDEAAGVQRYRTRKVESIKRLTGAREHLTRVDDILRELDAQREPLREEAEVAARYKAATSALREVETGLLIKDLAKAVGEIQELEARLSASADLVRSESSRAEALEVQVQEIRGQVVDAETRIEVIRTKLQDAITSGERAESGLRLSEERLRSLDELETTLRTNGSEEAVSQLEHELTTAAAEETAEKEALTRIRAEVGGVGEEARRLTEMLRAAEAELGLSRQRHALRVKQQAELEHRQERREQAARELSGIERELPGLIIAADEAQQAAQEQRASLEKTESEAKELEGALAELRQLEDKTGSHARSLMAERAALEGRRRGIEATLQAHEGLAQGSRSVLDAVDKGVLKDRYTPVGQAITTDRKHALAIETALGAAANDLIVDHESAAKAAITYLKQSRLGRATFQPLPLMRPQAVSAELRKVLGRPEVVGRASELVQCDPTDRPVIESLLGRVLVVSTLDASLRLAGTAGWSRMVTLEGEVVHASGAVSGGQTGKPQYGLVQRKADLSQIDKDLRKLQNELDAAEAQVVSCSQERDVLRQRIELTTERANRIRLEWREAKDFAHTLEAEVASATRSRDKLAKELEELSRHVDLVDAVDVEGLQQQRDILMSELASRSADANQAKQKLDDCEYRLQQASNRTASLTRRLEAARHAHSQREVKLQNLDPERHRIRSEIHKLMEEGERSVSNRKHAEADLREAQAARDTLLRKTIEVTEEAKSVRASIAAMADANHQAELNRARAEGRRASAAERLLEEYGIAADDALAQSSSIDVPADAYPLAQRLRREIRAMGNVNVGAVEAYERLALRFDELTHQRADILEGIEQVQASMHELDKLTRDRFIDTFSKVEKAYSQMFLKLFGGGEGRIFLDNPNSILESGIEIEVTLPGKKRQRLELLSGGERALCAAGFLFALLEVKPSPLVVLDEVDAPLDGRNVERFGDVLQEFTDRTQFIVITHNPTTIERAPVWLGVTMQEPGVSTLVPARLPMTEVVPQESARAVVAVNLKPSPAMG